MAAEPKRKSAITDPDNMLFEEVTPPEEKGMSAEDAYRHLAGLKPAPVDVEEQE